MVLYSEDWYGNINQSIGGNAQNNSKIFFTGHVLKNTIRYDYKSSLVSFEVGSITEVMKVSEGFSISVESKSNPSKWYELYDMDGRKAIWHYLKTHTTVLLLADMEWIGSDWKVQYFDSDRSSMYDAIDNFIRGTYVGEAVSDRQSKIWLEVQAEATPNATGTFTPIGS